jgi:hypothetical protein
VSSNLGDRQATGFLNPNNPNVAGAWTVAFDPEVLSLPSEFEVWHIALKGPSGSALQVYIDTTFFSNVVRGDINDWDPAQVLGVASGRTLFFHWNTATGSAPLVTIFCRQPLY